MLALFRRGLSQFPRCAAQINRLADQLLASMRRAFDRPCDADVPHLGVGEYLVDAIDRPTGHSGTVENLDPFRRGPGAGAFLDRRVQLVAVTQPSLSARVGRIGGKLLDAERLAETGEQLM